MSISKLPSKLSLPQHNPGVSSVLEYLIFKFPNINAQIWVQRINEGKVHWHDGSLITPESPYQPQQRVYYYRELEDEPIIPFQEKVVFQNEHFLIAYKPHFLPVTPGGRYINECLQSRLRLKTGINNLQAVHRLDRVTAGLVLFSVNPQTRNLYHNLFESQQIQKTYHAIASIASTEKITGKTWEVKNRLLKSQPTFLMKVVAGKANSHSIIRCLIQITNKALFELKPVTGKTHQLRLHMQSIGYPILHDKYYPKLQDESADDYDRPLQLLAKELRFVDPVSHLEQHFSCDDELNIK